MSKASTGFAFVAGLTIGAAGAWYYLKDKYAKLAEEEIASVKAAYAKREKPTTEEKTVSVVNAAKHMDKGIMRLWWILQGPRFRRCAYNLRFYDVWFQWPRL